MAQKNGRNAIKVRHNEIVETLRSDNEIEIEMHTGSENTLHYHQLRWC